METLVPGGGEEYHPTRALNTTRKSLKTPIKTSKSEKKSLQPITKKFASVHSKPRVKGDLLAAGQDPHSPDFLSVMSYNSHFRPHLTRDLYNPGYVVDNRQACRADRRVPVLVTILVISAPQHFAQRQGIRDTWGKAKHGVVFSFIVGGAEHEVERELKAEAKMYQDLIISRVTDHYENLGLKTISALDWVIQNCAESEYVLKVDDDMFVQVCST